MVIRDMEKNDAGKGVGILGERVSVAGPFIICLLMCILKNRHQASLGVLDSSPFILPGLVRLKKCLLNEHRRPVSWNSTYMKIVCLS